MADRVRSYSRRGPGGKTVRVNQHTRASRPRRAVVSYRHGWQLLKRSRRASRRKKTFLAITLSVLGVAEIFSVVTLDTTGMVLGLAGFLCLGAGSMAHSATGRRAHPSEARSFARGRRSSARAAEAHAQNARDRAATRKAGGSLAAQSQAWKKKQAAKPRPKTAGPKTPKAQT